MKWKTFLGSKIESYEKKRFLRTYSPLRQTPSYALVQGPEKNAENEENTGRVEAKRAALPLVIFRSGYLVLGAAFRVVLVRSFGIQNYENLCREGLFALTNRLSSE